MREPIILHDHIMGAVPVFREITAAVDAGQLDPRSPEATQHFRLPDGSIASGAQILWWLLLKYRAQGQQTFVVGPRLREMLEQTSLVGVPYDAIRFPFDHFYVALPESGIRLWGGTTGWHDVEGVLVSGFQETITLYLWGAENERSACVGDDASFWIDISLTEAAGIGLDVESYVETLLANPERDWSGIAIPGGKRFDDARQHADYVSRSDIREEVRRVVITALRVVLNLAVYLQHEGADRSEHPMGERARRERKRITGEIDRKKNPHKKKARHLLRELEKLSDAHITWLGRTLEETAERVRVSNIGSGAKTRHWVRGHWYPRLDNREARARHKLRWVQPYEKNRDATEAEPSRQYRFTEENP